MTETKKIRVVLVDDHEMVRMGLATYLNTEPDIEVIGEASNGEEGIKLAQSLQPDVMLMDLVMEGMDGIKATSVIAQRMNTHQKPIRVIVLTSFMDDEKVFPVLEAGACSYLLKTSPAHNIAQAIRKANKGESTIEDKVSNMMLKQMQQPKPKHARLTQRETEVLSLLGLGKSNQEIGEELHIGIKTVKTHVSNILAKLELDDRTQAAIYANKHGIVS